MPIQITLRTPRWLARWLGAAPASDRPCPQCQTLMLRWHSVLTRTPDIFECPACYYRVSVTAPAPEPRP